MEINPLFSDAKWKILKMLAEKEMSPLQISNELKTTVSNVSQQLKLLEVAGIVEKRRISNKKSNKPRLLFSLSSNHVYVVSCMKDMVDKNFFKGTLHHKTILKIWKLENPEMHYYIEKAFFELENHLKEISLIAIDKKIPYDPEFILVSEQPRKLKDSIKILEIKKENGKSVIFDYKVLSRNSFEKLSKRKEFLNSLIILYEDNKEKI